jgi:hypothetical protein
LPLKSFVQPAAVPVEVWRASVVQVAETHARARAAAPTVNRIVIAFKRRKRTTCISAMAQLT